MSNLAPWFQALLAVGALVVVVVGSYWSVSAIDRWSRDDYRRGLKDGRYHGDIGDL